MRPGRVQGRDSILAIALFVTLGTLVIQGTTIGWLTRRLRFDLTAERAAEKEMRERGRQVVADAAAEPSAGLDASFDAQRLAVGTVLHEHGLTEEVARELIEDLDLRQAAQHTVPRPGP